MQDSVDTDNRESRLALGFKGAAMQLLTTKWLWIVVAVWGLFCGDVLAAANGYPRQEDPYVNDYAGVIGQQDLQQLRTMLSGLKQQSGIDATVLTINSISEFDTDDDSIEFFANRLFDTWGIGDRATNKGVLLLVVVKDRKVRIELGKSYTDRYDSRMKEVIDKHILPAFKENDYSRGILQGMQALMRALSSAQPTSTQPRPRPQAPIHRPHEVGATDLFLAIGVLGLVVVGVIALFIIDWFRYGSVFTSNAGDRKRGAYDDSDDYSSSGSSFGGGGSSDSGGGGSSGGGGASGDW